jgi:hypothetical protein
MGVYIHGLALSTDSSEKISEETIDGHEAWLL